MRKHCVLDNLKECTNCGECDVCDLDSTKKCNNCGKCIESHDEYKVIQIEDIYSNEVVEELNTNSNDEEDRVQWDLIDDIKEISDLMKDEDKFKEVAVEEFPGFYKMKKLD